MSDKALGAENQQGSPLYQSLINDPSETTRRAPHYLVEYRAYLQGALHDASRNKRTRIRFVQNDQGWLSTLREFLLELGHRSWMYREGKTRSVYALETTAQFLDFNFNPSRLSRMEKIAYIRGFFDAEGGIPKNIKAKFYIQLVQKDKTKMEMIVTMLKSLGISCGALHNPSVKVDPNYWRVFVSTHSHKKFLETIGSLHPRKQGIINKRMMI